MKKGKIILAVLFLVILSSFVVAECDINNINKDNPPNSDCYGSTDFYEKSDPTLWDWKQVNSNLDKVDWSRDEIYQSPEFYNQLSSHPEYYQKIDYNAQSLKYSDLDYRYVDYTKADQRQIDVNKYAKDLGCANYDIEIEWSNVKDETGRVISGELPVTFSKEGIKHSNGIDYVSVPGNYPSRTLFKVTSEEIEVWLPPGTKTFTPLTTDTVTVDTFIVTSVSHEEITLPDGSRFSGKLTFDKGQVKILPGSSVTINNIEIKNLERNQPILINFDGKKHPEQENYISFGQKQLVMQSDQPTSIKFLPGNVYFKIEENDDLNLGIRSGMLTITNRDDQNLVPELKLSTDSKGYLDNGLNKISISENINLDSSFYGAGSVPMLLVKEGAENVLFDNYNNFLAFPEELPKELQCYDCNYNIEKNSVFLDFINEKLSSLPYNVNVMGDANAEQISQLYTNLKKLPAELSNAITGINLVSQSDLILKYCSAKATACAGSDGKIYLSFEDADSLSFKTISHEAAHAFTFQYENNCEPCNSAKTRILELAQQDGVTLSSLKVNADGTSYLSAPGGTNDFFIEKDRIINEEFKNYKTLAAEWRSIAGSSYGTNLGRSMGGTVWADGNKDEPRNGFFRAYGATDYYEDIATAYEAVVSKPAEFFKPYITLPGSPGYDSSKYDQRYLQKIDLLYRYGFIDKAKFDEIVGVMK